MVRSSSRLQQEIPCMFSHFPKSAFALMLMASSVAAAKDDLKITAIDVEGGFATLYVTPQRHSLLIDTGWPASAQPIADAVKAAGLKGIDYLLVTHYHVDHVVC